MQRLFLIIFSMLTTLFIFNNADAAIYCPKTVICSESGRIGSCDFGFSSFYDINGSVRKGTYTISQASYFKNGISHKSTCHYAAASGQGGYLSASATSLKPLKGENMWSWYGDTEAHCSSSTPTNCPFISIQ
jgi:hypothetical protein